MYTHVKQETFTACTYACMHVSSPRDIIQSFIRTKRHSIRSYIWIRTMSDINGVGPISDM